MEELRRPRVWSAYAGMKSLLELFDFPVCRRFLLAGCGPLPDTLFCLHDSTDVPDGIGIDRDPGTIRKARAMVMAFGLRRIRVVEEEACVINDKGFDGLYCSLFVTPRQGRLERIADTASSGTRVILRDPFFTGKLVFEAVAETLDRRLEKLVESSACPGRFMNKPSLFHLTLS